VQGRGAYRFESSFMEMESGKPSVSNLERLQDGSSFSSGSALMVAQLIVVDGAVAVHVCGRQDLGDLLARSCD
jgi:hypothetical protein